MNRESSIMDMFKDPNEDLEYSPKTPDISQGSFLSSSSPIVQPTHARMSLDVLQMIGDLLVERSDVFHLAMAFNRFSVSRTSQREFKVTSHIKYKKYITLEHAPIWEAPAISFLDHDYISHIGLGGCVAALCKHQIYSVVKFGTIVKRNDLLRIFQECQLDCTPGIMKSTLTPPGMNTRGHLVNRDNPQTFNNKEIMMTNIETRLTVPVDSRTVQLINVDDWFIPGPIPDRIGVLDNFDLQDLLNYQTTVIGFHCPPSEVYITKGKQSPECLVSLEAGDIHVEVEDFKRTYKIDDKRLTTVRHDFVASKLKRDTDMPLSTIGVVGEESVLTPDCIDTDSLKVIELGTSASESINTLKNEFEAKRLKYEYLLRPIGCNAYYLIVGFTSVVTNLMIQQSTVDDLCARFRVGMMLESKITELIGNNLFGNPGMSEDSRVAKALFSVMAMPEDNEPDKYPIELMLSMRNEPSDEDFDHSKLIVKHCLNESGIKPPESRSTLESYLSTLNRNNCQTGLKRITNVPLIHHLGMSDYDSHEKILDVYSSDMPSYMKALWSSADKVKTLKQSYEKEIAIARSNEEPEFKHEFKKASLFTPVLTETQKVQLALTGVGAKYYEKEDSIADHMRLSKEGFSSEVNTTDIDDFIKTDHLVKCPSRINSDLKQIVIQSKLISTDQTPQASISLWQSLLQTEMISYFDMVSEIFQEISYNYKQWTQKNQFLYRQTRSGIKMIIRNTGTHIFISFAFQKNLCKILDTGRLGPTIYSSNNYYFTDFSSFNEPNLEHFVKAGPYMTSLLIHLMSNNQLEPGKYSDNVSSSFNLISLLYLNNKTDAEELMTSQRYLFMKLFEDATQDPYIFVDRLPEVLRSRFSAYLLNKTIDLMDYYKENRILKIPKTEGTNVDYNYFNIRNFLCTQEITLPQKINEFYFGYVVSKERGRGSDRNFKIVKKILKEEYKFRDTVKNVFVDMDTKIVTYCTDPKLLKVIIHLFRQVLKDRVGVEYEKMIENDFLNNLSFTNFTQLATLKASARDHESLLNIPENVDTDRRNILKILNERNKSESSKRPKVLEALMKLVQEYKKENNRPVRHVMQLVPWCLNRLKSKGYFDSDIFPKPQHGGDREIHVLEISARLVQYTVELLSRTICKMISSETITHPETKERFVKDHYKLTADTYKTSFVISKSADASKWCQRHHVSHFAAMLIGVTPSYMHPFILESLKLWLHKKISFPLQLTATLLANRETFSTNDTFNRFRREFYSGTGIFPQMTGNKMEISSGMMQGILHYTSSLYHTVIQEVCRMLVIEIARKRFKLDVVCSVVQGSDDSGMMLGVNGKVTQSKLRACYSLLRFKEELSGYLSVYWNVCKSSIGTIDLIEYNSDWHCRHQLIKPTFRWISACMEISVTERFIDRIRIFNQVLTQCLEGGASTLECSVVQLCQAWMHYSLLGVGTSILSSLAVELIIKVQDPSLGFFPMDFDLACGIPGVDFQLYMLGTRGKYKVPEVADDHSLQYDFEGNLRYLVPKDLRSVKLRFGKLHIWKSLVDRLDIGTLEDAIKKIELDPMIIFGRHSSWDEELPNLIIKVFSPGVKESLNNISSSLRLMAASAYVLNRPCITVYEGETFSKKSLISALEEREKKVSNLYNSVSTIQRAYPLHAEYEEFAQMIVKLSKNHQEFTQNFKRTSKEKIIVFEVVKNEQSIMEICKRKWGMGGKVALSSRQMVSKWTELKIKFPFLKDTLKETTSAMKMTVVELKNFIESLELKSRSVTLQDSPVRQGNLLNAITRIYWPKTKIRSDVDSSYNELSSLRSNIFSICTFWYTQTITEKLVVREIQSCTALRKKYTNIPNRYRKLKAIHDWSSGLNKLDIIEQIKSMKQGVIGYFNKPQARIKGIISGEGSWIGQIMGISAKIDLQGKYIKCITLNHLSDAFTLGPTIFQLIKEFKSEMGLYSQGSNIWLSSTGKIVTRKHNDGLYSPIVIDKNLSVNVIKDIEINPWSIRISETTVRLIMTEEVSGHTINYTILSDSMSQRDWIPDSSFKNIDTGLNLWRKGLPMSVEELESNMSSIPNNHGAFLRYMRTIRSKQITNGWDMGKFRSKMTSLLVDEVSAVEHRHQLEQEMYGSEATTEMLQNLMELVSFGADIGSFSQKWADRLNDSEDDESWDPEVPGLESELTEEVKDALKVLSSDLETVYSNPDQDKLELNTWMRMNRNNKFFSNIDRLSVVHKNKTFVELYNLAKSNESIRAPGLLGKVLSFILGRLVCSESESDDVFADIASESSRQVNTILSQDDLDLLSSNELQDNIDQIESVLSMIPSGRVRDDMLRSQNRYKRLLLLKETTPTSSDFSDASYPLFMLRVINFLFDNKVTKFHDHNVLDNIKLSLIKAELTDFHEKQYQNEEISNHELTIIRDHIERHVVSQYLIQSLTDCYKITISFSDFRLTGNEKDIVLGL